MTKQRELFHDNGKPYFCCTRCGRCYFLKGAELTPEAEKKMYDREKSWIKQGEMTLCCRERHDTFLIKSRLG